MKLPDLPLSGSVRRMESGAPTRAAAREREITAAVRGVVGVTGAVAQYVKEQADNEARMQAITETARMNRSIEDQRRALQVRYLEDDSLSMDSYLEDDEKIVSDAVADSRTRLSRGALRYAESTLAQATGTAYTESRYKFFLETSRFRTDKHMMEFTVEAQEDIKSDPAKGLVYFNSGAELFNDLSFPDPTVKQATERQFKTAMIDTTLFSLAQNGQYNDMLALLDDDQYNNFITDVEAQRQVALAGVEEQFLLQQNSALASVSRDPINGDTLYAAVPGMVEAGLAGTDYQVDDAERGFVEKIANQQLQSLIQIKGDYDEAERRLNEGFYDDKLPADQIGDWMVKLQTAQAQAASSRVTVDLNRADRAVDGIKNGDPAASDATPALVSQLHELENNPQLSDSQRIQVREKRYELMTYGENPVLFGAAPTQMSRAELDATIAGVESLLITPEGADFETAAMRTKAVNDAVTRLEGLKREFDADPAAYLLKYNPEIAENYANMTFAFGNLADPEQRALLPQYLSQHMEYMNGKQGAEWGVANEDIEYFPKNVPFMQNLLTTLEGLDTTAKAGVIGTLTDALPPEIRPSFLKSMGAEDPGTAAAIDYTGKGLFANAENQIIGAQRRAGVNALSAKVVKDGEATEGLRRLPGGIPVSAIPPGGESMYTEVILNEYYAIASEEEINAGVPDPNTLEQARRNTWGDPVELPFSQFPDNKMLSYRRSDNQVMMTPAQVQGQLMAIRDNHVELEGSPETLYGGQVTQADIVTKGRFVPVGNGKYIVVMPEAVQQADRLVDGYVLDADTEQPYVIDLNDYPVSSVPLISPDFGRSL